MIKCIVKSFPLPKASETNEQKAESVEMNYMIYINQLILIDEEDLVENNADSWRDRKIQAE